MIILKHFLKVILLAMVLIGISFLPSEGSAWARWVGQIMFVAALLAGVGVVIWAIRGQKALLIVPLLLFSSPVRADSWLSDAWTYFTTGGFPAPTQEELNIVNYRSNIAKMTEVCEKTKELYGSDFSLKKYVKMNDVNWSFGSGSMYWDVAESANASVRVRKIIQNKMTLPDDVVLSQAHTILEQIKYLQDVDAEQTDWGGDNVPTYQADLDDAIKENASCAFMYNYYAEQYRKIMGGSCLTPAQYIIEGSADCWPCKIASHLIEATQQLVSVTTGPMVIAALLLLGVMLLYWLAFRVLKLIATMSYGKTSEFFSDLAMRLFVTSIAAILLSAPLPEFYNLVISPVINVSAGLTVDIVKYSQTDGSGKSISEAILEKMADNDEWCKAAHLENAIVGGKEFELKDEKDKKAAKACCLLKANGTFSLLANGKYMCVQASNPFKDLSKDKKSVTGCMWCNCFEKMNDPEASADDVKNACAIARKDQSFTPILTDTSISALLCLACSVYNQMYPLVAAGQSIWCYGSEGDGTVIGTKADKQSSNVASNWGALFIGGVMIVVFGGLMIFVAFYIVDIFLRLGFIFVLMPLLIATWAFPISRSYSKKAWDFLIHALMQFVGLALVVGFVLILMQVALPGDMDDFATVMTGDRLDALYYTVIGQGYEESDGLLKMKGGSSGFYTFFIFLAVGLVGFIMLKGVTPLVEALTGVALGFPEIAGSVAMGAVTQAGSLVGAAAGAAKKGVAGAKGGGVSKGGASGNAGQKAATKGKFENQQSSKPVDKASQEKKSKNEAKTEKSSEEQTSEKPAPAPSQSDSSQENSSARYQKKRHPKKQEEKRS